MQVLRTTLTHSQSPQSLLCQAHSLAHNIYGAHHVLTACTITEHCIDKLITLSRQSTCCPPREQVEAVVMSLEDDLAVLDLRYAELLRQQQQQRHCRHEDSSNDHVRSLQHDACKHPDVGGGCMPSKHTCQLEELNSASCGSSNHVQTENIQWYMHAYLSILARLIRHSNSPYSWAMMILS